MTKDSKKSSVLVRIGLGNLFNPVPEDPNTRIPTDVELLRFMAQGTFLAFCMAIKPDYKATKFHKYLCEKLQNMYESVRDGKDLNYIVEVQPQIGKSTTCSELFPAWVLGRSYIDKMPSCPVICASYGSDLAQQKSTNCRDIVNSEVYRMIFPETKLHPDTSAKDYWKTTTGGSYRAVGVGGGLTGMPGKFMIADDLFKDRAEADSETTRESTWKWWQTVFMSRRQDTSAICLVNTRWHREDVAGKVEMQYEVEKNSRKPAWQFDHWEQLTFPAFALEDEYIDGVLFRKAGEVLCPERFSFETMTRRRNATEVYEWSALYMQTPILKENAKFKDIWFKYYEPHEIKLKQLSWYILVDPASSKKKGADNTVIRAIGKERATNYWFFGDEIAGHFDPGQTVDAIFLMVKNYPGAHVWIEGVAYQRTLEFWVTEKQRKDQIFFNVDLLERKHVQGKEDRIEGLIPLYKNGLIFHRAGGTDRDYELELLAFPQGKKDDRIDAVSFGLDIVPNTAITETPEQKEARIREEKEDFDPHHAFNRI
jgi:hypothetical protein